MSHFTVGVILKEKDVKSQGIRRALEAAMDPFDENKEVEPRIDLTVEEVQKEFDEIVNYTGDNQWHNDLKDKYVNKTLEEFCAMYYGKGLTDEGIYTTYNEKSKWDWYVVGGRWDGCLPIKNRNKNNENCDIFDDNYEDNSCQIKDVEFKKEITGEEQDRLKVKYEELTTKGDFYTPEYYQRRYPTFESYLENELTFSTYALLTSDGTWHEPGAMGWFGISSAEPEDEINFKNSYDSLIAKEDPENYFVLVDCHI